MIGTLLLIGLGGALGAISRYWISKLNAKLVFPVGTLFVNLFGSFLLGFVWGRFEGETIFLFAGIGFLGALTTFSTLHIELEMLSKKRVVWLSYLVTTYLGGILLAYLGYQLT